MKHNILKPISMCFLIVLFVLIAVSSVASAKSESYEIASEIYSEIESGSEEQVHKSPFKHNDSEILILYQNGNQYNLYRTELTIDFNADGKCAAYDAREILRISAGLTEYDGDIAYIDINADGMIAAGDARLALRYSAKLDVYYTAADMTFPTGFLTDSNNFTYYMESGGVIANGLKTIDGCLYYFDSDKRMSTGLQSVYGSYYYFDENGKGCGGKYTINGTEYFFSDNGKSYSGDYTENGKTYFYSNGTKYTGWYKDGDTYRYYNTDGSMATGKTTINGTVYDFGTDGKMRNGFVSSNRKTYYYSNGVMITGKHNLNGNIYYFYNDGHMAKNESVGGIYYNSNGIATKADKSFFDDAVFIGDSVSVKLASYQSSTSALGKAQFFAASSLSAANSLWKVSSKSVHPKYNGQKTLIEDCVKYSGAKKVFIMLGMNDIGVYSFDTSISNYKELIARIKAKSPKVDIYIQSMTPMTSISTRADSKLNNTNIKLYNERLKKMCAEMGWHYLDVASALYDSTGSYLPQEYCSDPVYMGLHMSNKGCEKWVEYLLKNAAFV